MLADTWSTVDPSLLQTSDCSKENMHIHTNTTRTERKVQIFLTMCHPAMFTLIASPQVNLPRLKTFTRAVYQCATDGLKNKGVRKASASVQRYYISSTYY